MKKAFLIFICILVNVNAVEMKQEYIDNAEKYKYLNFNKADMSYAKKYEEEAKKKLNNGYNNLKESNKSEPSEESKKVVQDKYKQLEPTKEEQKEFKEKYKDLEKFDLNKKYEKEKINLEDGPVIVRQKPIEEKIVVENSEQLNKIDELTTQQNKEKEQNESFLNNLQYQTNLLDKSDIFNKEITKIKNENESYNKKNQTIFFFVSSDMRIESFKVFVEHINKLRRKGHNVVGRVIFRGWIDDKMDGIPNWLKKMQKEGLKNSEFVKYQFHPWAFRYFELKKVPAFALSSCYEDFKFRTCENKFLIKGDMSLIEFYKILSNEHKEYEKTYRDLLEVG